MEGSARFGQCPEKSEFWAKTPTVRVLSRRASRGRCCTALGARAGRTAWQPQGEFPGPVSPALGAGPVGPMYTGAMKEVLAQEAQEESEGARVDA